ncbi:hypothetical protein JBKA6_1312 [Ichthyobacterium seriolicida]|uniref:Uncharacterized protein n=1 Tax=Ichthyobacterium seriolicida TaxID=242600 RepID=A0A1J1E2Z4_9FLAO|nr:hypothetical protein JBKA6_1312 [Ichthyobacterium seriolicida]
MYSCNKKPKKIDKRNKDNSITSFKLEVSQNIGKIGRSDVEAQIVNSPMGSSIYLILLPSGAALPSDFMANATKANSAAAAVTVTPTPTTTPVPTLPTIPTISKEKVLETLATKTFTPTIVISPKSKIAPNTGVPQALSKIVLVKGENNFPNLEQSGVEYTVTAESEDIDTFRVIALPAFNIVKPFETKISVSANSTTIDNTTPSIPSTTSSSSSSSTLTSTPQSLPTTTIVNGHVISKEVDNLSETIKFGSLEEAVLKNSVGQSVTLNGISIATMSTISFPGVTISKFPTSATFKKKGSSGDEVRTYEADLRITYTISSKKFTRTYKAIIYKKN